MAVLPGLPRGAGGAGAPVVRALRPSMVGTGRSMPRLSTAVDRRRACPVPVRRSRAQSDPQAEVLRLAGRRRRLGRRDARGRGSSNRRRRNVGAPLPPTTRRARLRPGEGPCGGDIQGPWRPQAAAASAVDRYGSAGASIGGCATRGHAWSLRRFWPSTRFGPARRRRPHHGSDGRRMRGGVASKRRPPGPRAHRSAGAHGPGASSLYSVGPSSGSVVARGTPPR
jgi:hypothetical protein